MWSKSHCLVFYNLNIVSMDAATQQLLNREATAWKIITFNNLVQVTDMMVRKPEDALPNDFILRDVYFANVLRVPSNTGEPTFI